MAQVPYREHAARARADAEAATLDNVRERCLRAEAAWLEMAERQESVDRARARRERQHLSQQEST
ncbi:hypothetical protein [Sphingomonas sp.]|uniref:hypothetical protein n=1 Tax=Sphingomonas sp. TaxID=28214 RepID=UPI002EDA51B9